MEIFNEPLDRSIQLRVRVTQRDRMKRLAADLGMSVSDYIRYCVDKVAQQG